MNARLATLDRMLDDLKSTVHTDDEDRRTPLGIRSSSRSSSRAGSVGRRGGSADGGSVVDGGRLTHHRKEYTSPDQNVRTVADTYQYDSGDTHPSGQFQKKVVKSTYSSYHVDGGLSNELDSLKRGPSNGEMERALSQESRNILNSSSYTNKTSTNNSKGRDGRALSNGHADDDVIVNDEKGGEVRRIVWRNRYEKTYETADSNAPVVTIERDAKNRRYNTDGTNISGDATTITSLTRPHVPPQISPGGQSWADPVPLPTPPQVSPGREPGVAYIYNYGGSGGSAVQPLPPLNYVSVAPPTEGSAPSPTPSAATTGQPVIYHYSYHYTIQPGQPLPEGAHPPSSPPALQIVPPPATGYSSTSTVSNNTAANNVNSSTINEIHRDVRHHTSTVTNKNIINDRTTNRGPDPLEPGYPISDGGRPGYPGPDGGRPGYPVTDGGKPGYPGPDGRPGGPSSINYSINSTTSNYRTDSHHHPFPTGPSERSPPRDSPSTYSGRDPPSSGRPTDGDPNRNITININKTTTHTTRSTSSTRADGGEYPPDGQSPLTSTPYRGRSRSPERRYPAEPRYPSGPSDSLERVRRPHQPGLPFPDSSPVKPHDGTTRIPRKVDDLMNEFPVKNGGPHRTGYSGPDSEPLLSGTDVRSRQTRTEISLLAPERNEINTMSPNKLREEREKSKNQAGPPVYYPPGNEPFVESMHTMTLKEGGRRGKAKWRREAASGHQESSAHSESKGGMAMVPVCLPLCCGAACTIM